MFSKRLLLISLCAGISLPLLEVKSILARDKSQAPHSAIHQYSPLEQLRLSGELLVVIGRPPRPTVPQIRSEFENGQYFVQVRRKCHINCSQALPNISYFFEQSRHIGQTCGDMVGGYFDLRSIDGQAGVKRIWIGWDWECIEMEGQAFQIPYGLYQLLRSQPWPNW